MVAGAGSDCCRFGQQWTGGREGGEEPSRWWWARPQSREGQSSRVAKAMYGRAWRERHRRQRDVCLGAATSTYTTLLRGCCVWGLSWVTRSAVATVRRPQQTAERRENQSEPVSLTRLEGTGRLARPIVSACVTSNVRNVIKPQQAITIHRKVTQRVRTCEF